MHASSGTRPTIAGVRANLERLDSYRKGILKLYTRRFKAEEVERQRRIISSKTGMRILTTLYAFGKLNVERRSIIKIPISLDFSTMSYQHGTARN